MNLNIITVIGLLVLVFTAGYLLGLKESIKEIRELQQKQARGFALGDMYWCYEHDTSRNSQIFTLETKKGD